jgi:hypothetical protein
MNVWYFVELPSRCAMAHAKELLQLRHVDKPQETLARGMSTWLVLAGVVQHVLSICYLDQKIEDGTLRRMLRILG